MNPLPLPHPRPCPHSLPHPHPVSSRTRRCSSRTCSIIRSSQENSLAYPAPLVLVIQHYLGVCVQGPSLNFRNNIQNSNYEFQKFLCSQYFIIQHFVLQIILYFLSQPESKLMTLIDKKVSITFESVNISKSSKIKKLKLFEIQLLRLFYLHNI